jgi:hypothetical protein
VLEPILLLCALSLILLLALIITGAIVRIRGIRPALSSIFTAVSLGLLCAAVPLYFGTIFLSSPWDLGIACSRLGAGEVVEHRESLFPLSSVLECENQTVQFIPGWVNPLLFTLIGGAAGFVVAAVAADVRKSR